MFKEKNLKKWNFKKGDSFTFRLLIALYVGKLIVKKKKNELITLLEKENM